MADGSMPACPTCKLPLTVIDEAGICPSCQSKWSIVDSESRVAPITENVLPKVEKEDRRERA
jgi:uncharacterized Zn finger protein (UPF0148 family)